MLLKSRTGEIKSKAEWEAELDKFWKWANLQSRYMAKTRNFHFRRPDDAFERYARIIGLEETSSFKGVF